MSQAQTTSGKLTFALLQHSGRMVLDQAAWQVTELSAKANGLEWGERATQGKQQILAFLFVWSAKAPLNASSCRDEMLKEEHADSAVQNRSTMRSLSGVDIALASLLNPKNRRLALRAFVASGDLCGDLAFTSSDSSSGNEEGYHLTMETAKTTLLTLTFDPTAKPRFQDVFAYATAEYLKQQYAGAAVAYRSALALVDQSSDPSKFRRLITDQLSISLGISGDLQGSREVNERAIARDPDYPIYYYDLACADAEAGDAKAAQTHLQQAFDRRKQALEGESLPDPTQDNSLQKLRDNKQFWSLAQQISQKLTQHE